MRHRFVVTGGGSALGSAFVRLLSDDPNASLIVTTRGKNRPDSWGRGFCGRHLPGIDLLVPSATAELTAVALEPGSGPLHVINCVGHFPGFVTVSETDLTTARRVYESNVLAVQATAAALCGAMKRAGGGHFVTFSSHAVHHAYPLMGVFLSAKAAVESLVRAIANEHARDGVVATAIALATLDSSAERVLQPAGDHENWLQPEQVSRFVRHMVEDAVGACNGNVLHMYNYSPSYFGQSYEGRIGRKV